MYSSQRTVQKTEGFIQINLAYALKTARTCLVCVLRIHDNHIHNFFFQSRLRLTLSPSARERVIRATLMIMKKSPSEYRQQKSAQKNSANSKNFPNKKKNLHRILHAKKINTSCKFTTPQVLSPEKLFCPSNPP